MSNDTDVFSLRVPLRGIDYFTTVRLAVSGILSAAGADIDAAEDFKVCVTEALLMLKRGGALCAEVSFFVGKVITAKVVCLNRGEASPSDDENEISAALLGALVDKAEYVEKDGEIDGITLYKSL